MVRDTQKRNRKIMFRVPRTQAKMLTSTLVFILASPNETNFRVVSAPQACNIIDN